MNDLEVLARAAGIAVDDSAAARAEAESDFGGLARGRALGAVRPEDLDQLVKLVRLATKHGIGLTPRGSGRGQSGQSVAHDSLSVSMHGFATIEAVDVDDSSVWCGGGATWREVVSACAAHALVPPVVPLNLDLSVGGVLSAGGFGSTSHRFGALVENVRSVEVVTGAGHVVVCGPDRDSELFRAVLGGLGRCGFITRAHIGLRRSRPRLRTFYLHYREADRFVADQALVQGRENVDHLEGFCSASIQGLRKAQGGRRAPFALWSYGLHVSSEYDELAPSAEHVLSGMNFDRMVHIEDDDVGSFAARYDVRFEAMRMLGTWQQLHPWFECLISAAAAPDLLPNILDQLPLALGDGHRSTIVRAGALATSVVRPVRAPSMAFAVLPMGVIEPLRTPILGALAEVERILIAAGGKRYLSGWLFGRSEACWREHFGEQYDEWLQAKTRYDPLGILRSALFPT